MKIQKRTQILTPVFQVAAAFMASLLFLGVAVAQPSSQASHGPIANGQVANGQTDNGETKGPVSLKTTTRLETYHDLIEKAQNLTLQRDRLQASQVLIRGIQKESKGSQAYRELTRALESLSGLFYSDKAHGLFSSAVSMAESKPKEAIDVFNEALRLEDSNLSLLKGLARAQLTLLDCGKADGVTTQAEGIDPFSAEVKLLRLQVLACQKNYTFFKTQLASDASEIEPVQKFVRGLEMESLIHAASEASAADIKKAKALIAGWEVKDPEYPELYLWKWKFAQVLQQIEENSETVVQSSASSDAASRVAALKYNQLCQNLTARKRRSFDPDVRLCRSVDEVDTYLKSSGLASPSPTPVMASGSRNGGSAKALSGKDSPSATDAATEAGSGPGKTKNRGKKK